jgi:predicted Fe-Mo cluster-binding NifX family protein
MTMTRIAIPSDDEIHVAPHTGRCRGFAVYDLAEGKATKVEYRLNTYTQHHLSHGAGEQHQHGHGHSHAGILSGLGDCQAMIAFGMGRRLVDDLYANNFRVFLADTEEVEAAALRLAAGQLQEIPLDAVCHHGQHYGQHHGG